MYHHNGFVATHALGDVIYGYALLVPTNQRALNNPNKSLILIVMSDPRHTECSNLTQAKS